MELFDWQRRVEDSEALRFGLGKEEESFADFRMELAGFGVEAVGLDGVGSGSCEGALGAFNGVHVEK